MAAAISRRNGARTILLALLASFAGGSHAAADFSVKTEKRGNEVHVHAHATLNASRQLVWQTLTDYNHLPEFIPGISKSRLIEYRGNAAIVEQYGQAGFLFFKLPIDVTVESLEIAPNVIEVRVLKGSLKKLDGRYEIEEGATPSDPVVLRWRGVIEPQTTLPPLFGEMILRSNVTDQFRGMVNEIERRHAAGGTEEQPK